MKKTLPYLFVFFLYIACFGQDKPEPTNQLENTEILIEKYKKITFPTLNKITEKANTSKKQINSLEPSKYDFAEHPLLLPNIETKIKVPAIKDANQIAQYPHFVRFGLGNYLTTFAEGYVRTNAIKALQSSLHVKHVASVFGPLAYSGSSSNLIKGEVRYAMEKNILAFKTSYQRTGIRYYGYGINKPTNDKKDSIFQAYNNLQASITFAKIDTNTKWFYNFDCNYNYLNSKKNTVSENDINLKSSVAYEIDEFKKIKVDIGVNLLILAFPKSCNRSIYYINPVFEYKINDKLSVNGGFKVYYNQDTSKNIKNVRLYPHLDAAYNVTEKLKIYTMFSGGIIKNSYLTLVNENPFFGNNVSLSHTNQKINIMAGIKGTPIRYVYTNFSVGYQNVRNLALFTPSVSDSAKFDATFANGNIFNIIGEISFQKSEKFSLGLKAGYNGYSMANNEKAWLRPNFEAALLANYQLSKKIDFYLETYCLAGLHSKNFVTNVARELNTIVDINLKTNYKINDRLAIYFNIYNILGSKYERFVNYPVKSINFVGGFTFSF